MQLGKSLTSVYLMDYFLNPVFRGEIQHALNRGESIHTQQVAFHVGAMRTTWPSATSRWPACRRR